MEKSESLEILPVLVPFAILVFIIAIGVVLLSLQFRKNIYKRQLEKEVLTKKHQEKLLETSLQVQEEERKRIAQNLHDQLGAALSIARMQLVQLEKLNTITPMQIIPLRQLIENTLSNTRKISHELMPLNLKNLGLEKALKSLLDHAKASQSLKTDTIVSGINNMSELFQLELYRIYSELVNNTLKYAKASRIRVKITNDGAYFNCSYLDNGMGLNKNELVKGLGFRSIEHRINTLRGTIKYGNSEAGGFYAQIKLPITNENEYS